MSLLVSGHDGVEGGRLEELHYGGLQGQGGDAKVEIPRDTYQKVQGA